MSFIITDSNKEYRHGSSRGGDKTHTAYFSKIGGIVGQVGQIRKYTLITA